MLAFIACVFATIFLTSSAAPKDVHPDAGLDISQFLDKYRYPLESHEVETEDGYILTLHRIPHGVADNSTAKKPPIFLMHGLLCSSMDWVNLGPEKALALLLADAGYDVWLGNQRGNTWSKKHLTLDPLNDTQKFFNFSFHEVGVYDLPAKIDYILETTGEENLIYVGHSQGCTSFFIMASERPDYNDKIRFMVALAPAVFMGNMPNFILREVANNLELVENLATSLNLYEFLPHYEFITTIGELLCNGDSDLQDACALVIELIAGFDNQVDPDFLPVVATSAPAGASISQAYHYLQEYLSKKFRQYDLGADGNLAKYGQETPPDYDLSKVTAPVSLHYGNNDLLVAIEDVAILNGLLPNVVSSREVPEQFNHLDFLWAAEIKNLLYNDVITEIKART